MGKVAFSIYMGKVAFSIYMGKVAFSIYMGKLEFRKIGHIFDTQNLLYH